MKREYSLCKSCHSCPRIKIEGSAVAIGEKGNQVKLRAGEWNELVKLVKSGKAREL